MRLIHKEPVDAEFFKVCHFVAVAPAVCELGEFGLDVLRLPLQIRLRASAPPTFRLVQGAQGRHDFR